MCPFIIGRTQWLAGISCSLVCRGFGSKMKHTTSPSLSLSGNLTEMENKATPPHFIQQWGLL